MAELLVEFGEGRFVCPWCAGAFNGREVLDEHWRLNRECAANRNVSNQTQSKYLDRTPGTLKPILPGEHVLELVEAKAAAARRRGRRR
jgi:hypothetical protein